MPTKVKTTNQEFPIPDEWVALTDDSQEAKNRRDELLRRKLGGLIPAITNGVITVREEGGEQIVRVTQQLGTKAAGTTDEEGEHKEHSLPPEFYLTPIHCDLADVLGRLQEAPPYLPPVLKLALELKWLLISGKLTFDRLVAYQPTIREALEERHSTSLVEELHRRLCEVPPPHASYVPLGF